MAIVIGDIHGDLTKARAFLDLEPAIEHVVLGDLIDSRKRATFEGELACLELLLESDAILIWGNHDLAYLPEEPWRISSEHAELSRDQASWYSAQSQFLDDLYNENGALYAKEVFRDRYLANLNRFVAAHAANGWLCTHAGVSPRVAELIPPEVKTSGTESIADWLNKEFGLELKIQQHQTSRYRRFGVGPLFQVPICRGGGEPFGGIFWYDYLGEMVDPDPSVGNQIFGHTPVPYPDQGTTWINLNASDEGMWVYDTETNLIFDAYR